MRWTPSAIERVCQEAWPEAETADELHDALLTTGLLTEAEGLASPEWLGLLTVLAAEGRAGRVPPISTGGGSSVILWIAAERLPELQACFPDLSGADVEPRLTAPGGAPLPATREAALRSLLRSRLEVLGPVLPEELAAPLGISSDEVLAQLQALEVEGVVLRGRFSPRREGGGAVNEAPEEWCERRLLSRIHRATLDRLFRWQRVEPGERVRGVEGLAGVLESLDGYELPAVAWEADVLAARVEGYEPEQLDRLCLAGRVRWGRLSPPARGGNGRRTSGPLEEHAHSALAQGEQHGLGPFVLCSGCRSPE